MTSRLEIKMKFSGDEYRYRIWMLTTVVFFLTPLIGAQLKEPNYDEAKVPPYTLPELLRMQDGSVVKTPEDWFKRRRPEILSMFADEMFGQTPKSKPRVRTKLLTLEPSALGGTAVRKEVSVQFAANGKTAEMRILLYLPKNAKKPAPLFLGLNFDGNQAVNKDPGITVAKSWMENSAERGISDHKATEQSRGSEASRWAVEKIVTRGYGLATAYYGDLYPDFDGGMQESVLPLFFQAGQTQPAANEWQAIGAWAWGLSRALDYLETDKDVDSRHVAVMGHSRLGKTALWAGAEDTRFAMVISNDSGAGGAALNKRIFGETVEDLNVRFPHWFCRNFRKYNNNEAPLPFDSHMLIALIAPRPVYVASAQEDLWADPRGEFLAAYHAGPVYRLLGKEGLPDEQMPGINEPIMKTVGYHIRSGKHDVTDYDWERYMDFADLHYGRTK
jgi:hypothetical protein